MGHKKILIICLIFSFVILGLSYWGLDYYRGAPCPGFLEDCSSYKLRMGAMKPLIIFLPFFSAVLLYVIFFSKKVFKLWAKCASVVLVFLILLVAGSPISCDGIVCVDKGVAARLAAGIFPVVSFFVITISAIVFKIRERKGNIDTSGTKA